MTKYHTTEIILKIKEDSKKAKKYNKNKNLSYFQNEFSKVFGYRHFHELIKIDSQRFDKIKRTETIEISSLEKEDYSILKEEYKIVAIDISNGMYEHPRFFNNIKPLKVFIFNDYITLLSRKRYDFTKSFFVDFSNEDFEIYMKKKLEIDTNKMIKDEDFSAYLLNFNKMMFKLFKHVQPEKYQEYYSKTMNLTSLIEVLIDNKDFKCDELEIFFNNNPYKRDQLPSKDHFELHCYVTMCLTNIINGLFNSRYSEHQKRIKFSDIKNQGFEFLFYDEKDSRFQSFSETIAWMVDSKKTKEVLAGYGHKDVHSLNHSQIMKIIEEDEDIKSIRRIYRNKDSIVNKQHPFDLVYGLTVLELDKKDLLLVEKVEDYLNKSKI